MGNLTLVTLLLLCSLSLIPVSLRESQTVEVQSGEEVTLLCSNFSSAPTQILWFRAVKRSNLTCVSFMFKDPNSTSYCQGFLNGKFEMTSNMSTVFLRIKPVNSSDSGLYFCGYHTNRNVVIVEATNLEVQEVFDVRRNLTRVILGALTVFLLMVIICLVVKIKTLQKGDHAEEQTAQQTERLGSDDLNYAAVTFHAKTDRHRGPASEGEVEGVVIYSATR
ncbi:uncharacterized protein [Brachyistius frenatus]|uniref:uncharacterized protein n=1 Tax=Brachyistius frenatus TaxID=100188 RepID=UPI0037E95D25